MVRQGGSGHQRAPVAPHAGMERVAPLSRLPPLLDSARALSRRWLAPRGRSRVSKNELPSGGPPGALARCAGASSGCKCGGCHWRAPGALVGRATPAQRALGTDRQPGPPVSPLPCSNLLAEPSGPRMWRYNAGRRGGGGGGAGGAAAGRARLQQRGSVWRAEPCMPLMRVNHDGAGEALLLLPPLLVLQPGRAGGSRGCRAALCGGKAGALSACCCCGASPACALCLRCPLPTHQVPAAVHRRACRPPVAQPSPLPAPAAAPSPLLGR